MTNEPTTEENESAFDRWQEEYDRKAEEYFAEYPKDEWNERDRYQW